MATTTTRINGASSQNNYGFYLEVIVDDTIQSDNTFIVNVDAYIVNNGTRTNTNGWDKQTIVQGIGQQTDTNQTLNTTGVAKEGGVTLAIRHYGIYRVPVGTSQIYVTGAMARNGGYASYDPGYCEAKGWVSMPKVQSTWGSSLISIPDITQSFTLPINKYVNNYYNVVEVRNQNNSILIKTINDAVDGTSVTFTSSELNTIYAMDNNKYQQDLRFYLDLKTYTNSSKTTQIGTTQRTICEAYLPNPQPTATYTTTEQDAKVISFLQGDTTKIIKNASDLLFTITATPKYSALISSVKVNDVFATLSSGNYVLNITNLTTGTFNIVVTDSRGYSTTYTASKTLLDYIACKINSWSIQRENPVSSDLVLNANVSVYNDTIDGNTNTIVVKYSIDNENWTTIPSSSYTITDNVLTISNLTLSNIVPYTSTTTFYLDISDLLSEAKENFQISKGIETYSWGENDLQVNGDLFVADTNGENAVNVMSRINTINTNLSTRIQGYGELCNNVGDANWNNVCGEKSGFYMGSGSNGPTGGWVYLLHLAHNNLYQKQIAFDFFSNSVYTRRMDQGTWQNWVQLH